MRSLSGPAIRSVNVPGRMDAQGPGSLISKLLQQEPGKAHNPRTTQ